MTTYAFDIHDATLAEIREIINRKELENVPLLGQSTFTGDGVRNQWYVAPPGYYVYEDGFTLTVDGASATHTLDPDTGIVTLNSIPADGAAGLCTFTAVQFPDFMVDAAINMSAYGLYPYFYKTDLEIVTTDGSTYEFELPESVDVVTSVDYRSDANSGWSARSRERYTIFNNGDALVLRFYSPPPSGYLRVHVVSRPGAFTDASQTLSGIGVPERAMAPIVSGAVWHLLNSKAAVRIRTDVAVATMGTGTVFPSMMTQVADKWAMRYQFELQSLRMRPWMVT